MHQHATTGCASDTVCARSEVSSANTHSEAGEARGGASSAIGPGARRLRGGVVAVASMADTDAGVEGNGVRKGDEAVIIHRPRHKVDQQHSLNATKLTPPPHHTAMKKLRIVILG
jgi:hypothetical protein